MMKSAQGATEFQRAVPLWPGIEWEYDNGRGQQEITTHSPTHALGTDRRENRGLITPRSLAMPRVGRQGQDPGPLLNEMAGDHPMHQPVPMFTGWPFLILSPGDGAVEENLVWKDTVSSGRAETFRHPCLYEQKNKKKKQSTKVGLWMADNETTNNRRAPRERP